MVEQTLIKEKGYEGQYVALKSLTERKVIASGKNANKVMQQAKNAGHENPVLFFVQHGDVSLVY